MSTISTVSIALVVVVVCSSCAATPIKNGGAQPAQRPAGGKSISLDAIAKSPTRTLEELQLAFDRNKERFYALVNAHLRRRPGSEGRLVLNITVEPDGTVSDCRLVSSTLSDAILEEAIVSEARSLNIGARAVPTATFPTYPIIVLAW